MGDVRDGIGGPGVFLNFISVENEFAAKKMNVNVAQVEGRSIYASTAQRTWQFLHRTCSCSHRYTCYSCYMLQSLVSTIFKFSVNVASCYVITAVYVQC